MYLTRLDPRHRGFLLYVHAVEHLLLRFSFCVYVFSVAAFSLSLSHSLGHIYYIVAFASSRHTGFASQSMPFRLTEYFACVYTGVL